MNTRYEDTMDATGLETATNGIRAVLSLRETVILAEVPEKTVRKDIEAKILSPARCGPHEERHCFAWTDVFVFAAVYRNQLLTRDIRKVLLRRLEVAMASRCEDLVNLHYVPKTLGGTIWDKPSNLLLTTCNRMNVDEYLFIDFDRLREDVTPRVDLYAYGLSRIEEKAGRLGGEAVFKNTRLSVRHIGKMYADGELLSEILIDYPYLEENDVKFARLYHEAHPTLGRPRARAETESG